MSVTSSYHSRCEPASQKANHDKLVVSPRRARHMLDCGNTRLYELLKQKELESYLEGRSRKITVESIHQLIERRLRMTRGASDRSYRRRGREHNKACTV